MNQLSERVAAELTRIHRPSYYYQGLNAYGQHLLATSRSATVGMGTEGMNRFSCCATCRHSGPGDAWPCETAALLVEAGLMPVQP